MVPGLFYVFSGSYYENRKIEDDKENIFVLYGGLGGVPGGMPHGAIRRK
jgi:hypothetical protein